MEPSHSIDVTDIVEEYEDRFLVYRSPDSAEEWPDYDLIAEFKTRAEAEDFLTNSDEDLPGAPGPIGFVN